MPPHPPTVVVRHRKENLSKCSLRGLEERPDLVFVSFRDELLLVPMGTILPEPGTMTFLTLDAPELSRDEGARGIFLLDATWRRARTMAQCLAPMIAEMVPRSLPPSLRTAYPRRQTLCPDPARGLASVEALFVAYRMLGRNSDGILDGYLWRERFLELNPELGEGGKG